MLDIFVVALKNKALEAVRLEAVKTVKKKVYSCAAPFFIVLGATLALVGQVPSPAQHTLPDNSPQAVRWSQSSTVGAPNTATSTGRSRGDNSDTNLSPLAATFLSATQISAGGTGVYPVVSGDFNGDQLPDVITVIQNSGSPTGVYVSVLLNTGFGIFNAPVLTPVTFGASDFIIVADLNYDGADDVVLVHPNSMDVLMSTGGGAFAAPQNLPTGINSPVAAAFWDVNQDGWLDVVVVDGQSNQAAYLLGNGQGSFGPPQMTSFPAQVSVGVLADVDLDGNIDLVTNNTLYPGDGNGGFMAGIAFQNNDGQNAGAVSSNSVAVADVNGDGFLDVVTANGNWNTVSVFLNQGGRQLVEDGASFWSGNEPVAVAIADVNWDGNPDLVVVNAAESDVSVFLGNGNGTFVAPRMEFAIGGSPSATPVLTDFNGDGDVDVLVSNNQSSIVLALGNGDGTLQADAVTNIVMPPGSSNSGGAISTASADFNGDGIPDFVIGQSSASTALGLVVFLGESNGSLGKGVIYAQDDTLSYVAVGDLYQDGKADIVASNSTTGDVEVLRGNGDGTFQAPISISLPGITNGLVVADLNGDGWPDVAAAGKDSVVYILLNNGQGSLALAGTYPISAAGGELVTADFNHDGKPDLAIALTSTSRVAILLGNGNGSFSAAPDYDTTLSSVYGIAAGDLNNDVNPDLVVTSPSAGSIAVALGNGTGAFGAPAIYAASLLQSQLNASPEEVALSDVNDDGQLDIIYANSGYSSVGVLFGSDAGSFSGPSEFATGGGAFGVAIADFNNSGRPDVVTADAHFTGVSVLYNMTASQPVPSFSVMANPGTVQLPSGGIATTTISLLSRNGFIGSVQLACQNLPQSLSCVFASSTLHLVKGTEASTQLTISAVQSKLKTRVAAVPGFGNEVLALSTIPILGGMFFWRGRRAISQAALLVIVASLMLLIGCQGVTPTTPTTQTPPPSQTYTMITVTATAWNGTSQSVQMQLSSE